MPQFVILRHEMPAGAERRSHYDLMLERDGVLQTWALEDEPAPGAQIAAERLADHRLAYLSYEGPVSQGRGEVVRWDRGEFELVAQSEDEIVVDVAGERVAGRIELRKGDAQRWIARFVRSD
jgi:hypothetical protein